MGLRTPSLHCGFPARLTSLRGVLLLRGPDDTLPKPGWPRLQAGKAHLPEEAAPDFLLPKKTWALTILPGTLQILNRSPQNAARLDTGPRRARTGDCAG